MVQVVDNCIADSTNSKDNGVQSTNKSNESETENDEKTLEIDTGNTSLERNVSNVSSNAQDASMNSGSNKRSSSDSEGNPTPTKKVRSKPKPQEIENMKEYLDSKKIEKLTTTTLLHWLKGKSVHCTTRDKKAVLIEKIKNFFAKTAEISS